MINSTASLNAQEKMEAVLTNQSKNIILALYILGLISSVAVFFSYSPLVYLFMAGMFIGLISGLKYGETVSSKFLLFIMRFSYLWLVILLILSISKTVRPYVVL